jgi:hypothetical protein
MKKIFTLNNLTSGFFYFSILLFLIGFNFTDAPPPSGWYQQWMPNLGGRSITDIFFLDSLTGWGVTNATNQANDTTYVLKTTNGGDNWVIQYQKVQTGGGFPGYYRVYFLNQITGFVCGVTGIDKSTDGGSSWILLNAPFNSYLDLSVLSQDTIWSVSSNPLTGGVFLTTNGGANWIQQAAFGINNPSHIYMFNARIGFIDGGGLKKTSDGGTTWVPIPGGDYFTKMYLIDSLTGWKCNGYMKKTTDGGYNWTTQSLPEGGIIITSEMNKFSNISRDTIWGVGGWVFYSANGNKGMIYRTTDGGNNWLFQVPDTSINISEYYHNSFIDKLHGWAYPYVNRGVHTITGGDPIFYTNIKQISFNVSNKFELGQNYPNPFNPKTNIKYQITKNSYIKLIVYDITGKKVAILVDQKQSAMGGAGTYEVSFDGSNYSSGVYFYSLIVDGIIIDTKRMVLVK